MVRALYDAHVLKILSSFFLLAIAGTHSFGQSLSALANKPDWSKLEKYQNTITRQEFVDLLDRIYAPNALWRKWITITRTQAQIAIHVGNSPFILHFAPSPQTIRPIPCTWKSRSDILQYSTGKPLSGLHITLDPGHLGGKWAKMEERWFQIGRTSVKEGDMTLIVAKILANRLRTLGAGVTLTRSRSRPITSYRAQDFRSLAISELRMKGMPATAHCVQKRSEQLFYRVSEIRNRARMINEILRPDLVICLHFNAEEWNNKDIPRLTPKNHLHLLVTGGISTEELAKEDQRFDILLKLLSRTYTEEIPIARALTKSLARNTSLPPYSYTSTRAIRISPYVWARNLLATRLFQCPVVFIEAYVMNNPEVVARIQAGNYSNIRRVSRMSPKRSIYREYAEGIVEGLLQYYTVR